MSENTQRTVPGKNGGTLIPWPKGVSGNPGGGVMGPALAHVIAATKSGKTLAEFLLKVASGTAGKKWANEQLNTVKWLWDRMYQFASADHAPVIDWDKATDAERSELNHFLSRVREISERQERGEDSSATEPGGTR